MFPSVPKLIIFSAISLSLVTGCSKLMKQDEPAIKPVTHKADQFDGYYGMPERDTSNNNYASSPKYKKIRKQHVPLNRDAPVKYTVKKGDTLWDISNKFLKDPWFWPEIWDKNQRIQNPHLIYPGDRLYIYQSRRKVQRGGETVEVLVPQIRVERIGSGEPISAIAPFLSWPRVLDNETIEKSPYIVDGRDSHLLLEEGQTVYIKNLRNKSDGQMYSVYRKGKPLHDPETNELLGYEVIYTADTYIDRGAGSVARGSLLNSKQEVRVGDRLLKNSKDHFVLNAPMLAPKHKVRASVMALYEASLISGMGMILTLDAGATEGIKPGHILGVYSPGRVADDPHETKKQVKYRYLESEVPVKVELPPERVATAVVYKVGKQLSYALITKSDHPVKKGYKIGNP